ncbi:MAG: cysteine peptidase family C39 domain-containing protein [Patescibacteria group bacterium]|nr:cysteine peptidase family C39 domain-containing protein [Patescibacteria group bacterium]
MSKVIKPLKVKHYRERPGYCGPASLKILFSHYGVEASEIKLGRIAGTVAKIGTFHEGLVKAAEVHGFKTYTKERATFKDLDTWINRKKTPVIVDWFSDYDDHYAVVIGLDKKYIYMDDPELDKPMRRIERSFFNHIWFGFTGKNNEKVSWRWMMTIEPKIT